MVRSLAPDPAISAAELSHNKTTNDNFSAKNKLTISETNFTKYEGKVSFGELFLKIILLTS